MIALESLLQSIDQFVKLAGMLEVPKKLLEDTRAWARSVYCSRALWELDEEIHQSGLEPPRPPYKRNAAFVRALCLQNIKPGIENPMSIPLSLEDSKYLQPAQLADLQERMAGDFKPMSVLCHFIFSKAAALRIHNSAWSGLWTGNIYLYKNAEDIRLTEADLKRELADIDETVRHELQHLMQSYLAYSKAIGDGFGGIESMPEVGLPGKKIRSPQHYPNGAPKTKENKPDEADPLPHELRDIEFYPRLADTIADYKAVINKVPIQLRKMFFSAWVAQITSEEIGARINNLEQFRRIRSYRNVWLHDFVQVRSALTQARDFFAVLKNSQPGKYQKAVKEVFKELSGAGLV